MWSRACANACTSVANARAERFSAAAGTAYAARHGTGAVIEMEQPHQDATGALPQGALPKINGYKLLRLIGHGGMSTVYLAEQESLGRKVAVKVMLPEALADEVSRRRFENEARTIARLDHPNIVGIYEVGRTRDDLPYYAMPYLGRGHLASRISRQNGHTRDQAKVIATLRSLLEALDYAHVRGVVHRDVKAENVLFAQGHQPAIDDDRAGSRQHRVHAAGTGAR